MTKKVFRLLFFYFLFFSFSALLAIVPVFSLLFSPISRALFISPLLFSDCSKILLENFCVTSTFHKDPPSPPAKNHLLAILFSKFFFFFFFLFFFTLSQIFLSSFLFPLLLPSPFSSSFKFFFDWCKSTPSYWQYGCCQSEWGKLWLMTKIPVNSGNM